MTKAKKQEIHTLRRVVDRLKKESTKKQVEELKRYGIEAHKPFGVTVATLRSMAKEIGTNHDLALELWATERYEARMLATMIDDPSRVTASQMNQWARDFDNWAIVDTACFSLFDQTKHAWKKTEEWSKARLEFKKRASFALIWSLSVHDKEAANAKFVDALELIETGAEDERHWVKKAVNMALRALGKRNKVLNGKAIKLATKLSRSENSATKWIGSHALRELQSDKVQSKLK